MACTGRGRAVFIAAALLGAWVFAVGWGKMVLLDYSYTGVRPVLPAGSVIDGPLARPMLVMSVHPLCPCTRASVAELARLAPRLRERADIVALVYRPLEEGDGWVEGAVWRALREMPGVEARIDPGGLEAEAMGLEVSGEVLLLSESGEALFAGGITPGRGHEGPSAGRESLLSWVTGAGLTRRITEAYGCGLAGPVREGGGE